MLYNLLDPERIFTKPSRTGYTDCARSNYTIPETDCVLKIIIVHTTS
jgi:hypothetical protein